MVEFGTIPERIYEAAFFPELWVSVLDELALATGSGVGAMGIYWPHQRGITTSFEISPGSQPWEQTAEELEGWLAQVRAGQYANRGFFQLDLLRGDWSGLPNIEERLENHRKRGFGVQTGTIIELFNGEIIELGFTRRLGEPRYDDGLVASLQPIHVAFKQSAFFASRLQFERARCSVDTLNDFGLPAALVNGSGQILLTNELFDSVDHYVARSSSGRVAIRGSDTLRKTFAEALEQSVTRSVSVPIPPSDAHNPAVVQLMPLCRDATAIFSMSCTVMVLSPVATTVGVPSCELASKLFGLTRAEARLAVALASGLSLRDSAASQGISFGTARAYLVRIFSKTATNQQSELVSLLKGISSASSRRNDIDLARLAKRNWNAAA